MYCTALYIFQQERNSKTMASEKMTVAGAMVKALEAEGITMAFGYPGAAICPFYDELNKSEIKHILVRHEVNGGHAANGYARMTGKPAVAIATSGPGATNLITAIATAYMDSIPMVVITGQVNCDQIGRDVFQEADITGAAEPFVKHSYLVKNAADIPVVFKNAFYIAGSGRPGPVLIDVPFDVQKTEIDFEYPKTADIRSYKPSIEGNRLQIKRALTAIGKSKKPLICAGGGIFTAQAQELLQSFAQINDIPVVNTMMGLSSMPADNPLFYGMIGMHGVPAANYAIGHCDLLILLGARVGDRAVTAISKLDGAVVIHIDVDPAEIGKNIAATIPVVGDVKNILGQLIKDAQNYDHYEWKKELDEIKSRHADEPLEKVGDGFVNPKEFIRLLSARLPADTVISADVGQNQIWTCNNIELKSGRFITSGGMGTMGYSIPAAIGAKASSPKSEVIAICGDGSFQMQFMELATMLQHGIFVKVIVMKNNRLGMVREVQTNAYDNRLTAVFLDGSPDFIKLAQAYSIPAKRITDINSAADAIDEMLAAEGCYLLEVEVEENQKTIL